MDLSMNGLSSAANYAYSEPCAAWGDTNEYLTSLSLDNKDTASLALGTSTAVGVLGLVLKASSAITKFALVSTVAQLLGTQVSNVAHTYICGSDSAKNNTELSDFYLTEAYPNVAHQISTFVKDQFTILQNAVYGRDY